MRKILAWFWYTTQQTENCYKIFGKSLAIDTEVESTHKCASGHSTYRYVTYRNESKCSPNICTKLFTTYS